MAALDLIPYAATKDIRAASGHAAAPPPSRPPQQGWSSDINAPVARVLKHGAHYECRDYHEYRGQF
jgi:hypothetical protein